MVLATLVGITLLFGPNVNNIRNISFEDWLNLGSFVPHSPKKPEGIDDTPKNGNVKYRTLITDVRRIYTTQKLCTVYCKTSNRVRCEFYSLSASALGLQYIKKFFRGCISNRYPRRIGYITSQYFTLSQFTDFIDFVSIMPRLFGSGSPLLTLS